MRKIRDVLRLKLEARLSHERIAASLGISKGVVAKYVGLASVAGLDWTTIRTLSDTALERRVMQGRLDRPSDYVLPGYGRVHQELRRKGMTLMLLWEEHVAAHPGQPNYRYSQFCERYRRYALRLKRSMRQIHRTGEKLFVATPVPRSSSSTGAAHTFSWPRSAPPVASQLFLVAGWSSCPWLVTSCCEIRGVQSLRIVEPQTSMSSAPTWAIRPSNAL